MDDNIVRTLVVGVGVFGGAVIGHYATLRQARAATAKAIHFVIQQSVFATSMIGTIYIDAMIEHMKLTPQEAANKLLAAMNAAGVPVKAIQLGRHRDVNEVK